MLNRYWRFIISNNSKLPNVNEQIRSSQIRLIDQNGEMIGVVPVRDALYKAKQASLDLVEISPTASPPVCKIMDFGKYKYELKKKQIDAKKKQKIVNIKEIKLRPNIGDHDYQVKLKSVLKFISDGDKVKFTLRFRGREIANIDLKDNVLTRFREDVKEVAKIELSPKLEGKQMVMIVTPI